MSPKPSGGALENPKLAEAIAALKHGLEDDADPLYDSWKLRKPKVQQEASSDTIPARVIAYRVFPKWAILLAAAAVVFALVAVALRLLRPGATVPVGARADSSGPIASAAPTASSALPAEVPPPAASAAGSASASPKATPRHRETGIFREPGF
jgi:hypothetical protein